MTEQEQIEWVKRFPLKLNRIENPSEAVQLAAVQSDGWAISYIENPSEASQLAAVQQDGTAIEWIKNPTDEVQLAAVQQEFSRLEVIRQFFAYRLFNNPPSGKSDQCRRLRKIKIPE